MTSLRSYFVTACALSGMTLSAQNKIAVQHGSSVTFFDQTSLQAALDGAQNGDVVYLPGGSFAGQITLNKSLQIIGAGYFPDSSAATTPTTLPILYLTANASNSYISGINFSGPIYGLNSSSPVISNLVIQRCHLQSGFGSTNSLGNGVISYNSSGIVISECVVGTTCFSNAQNCVIRNCIVTGVVSQARNTSVQSSILLANSNPVVENCGGCSVQGNIFVGSTAGVSGNSSTYASVSRNCFVNPSPSLQYTSGYGNVVGANAAQLFVAYTSPYDYSDNFHLGPSSAAIGTGPAGIDCGIYGGPSPWKPGGVPYNPHIQQQFIGTATDQQGNLPVQIKVGAQGN